MTPPRPYTTSRSREALVNYGLPALIATLVVAGAAWFALRHGPRTRRDTVATIGANLDQRMATHRAAIETWLDEFFQDAAVIASFPTVREELSVPRPVGRGTNRHLGGILASTVTAEHIEAIFVLDTALRTVSSTQPRLDPAAIPFLRAALTSRRPAADLVRYASGTVRVVIARPVIVEPARGPIGLAVLVVSPTEWLFPFLDAPPVDEPSGEALLVRRDGDSVLYLTPLRLRPAPPLTFRRPVAAQDLAALAALAGTSGFGEYRDYRNVPVFASIARLSGAPWALVVKVDQQDALGIWRQRMWATAITEGGLLLLAALLVAAFWWGLRKAHQAAEARSRAHIATLLDQASDAIVLSNLDGSIREANRRAHEFYGFPGDSLIGRMSYTLRPPRLHDDARAQLRTTLTRDEALFRTVHVTADGREVPVEVSSRRVRVGDDDVLVSVVRDIGERQAAEARVLRLNQMLRTLTEINELMIRGQSSEEVLREACRIAVEHGGFRLAWVAVAEPDGTVRSVAAAGVTGYMEGIQVRWDDTPQGRGPAGTALRENRTVVIANTETDPAFAPWRERARAHGLRSCAACPIRKQEAAASVLLLYADTPGFFDAESTVLLEELAGDLGFALRTLEERAALRDTEAKLGAFFHSPAIGMLFGDIHGRILDANDELLRVIGYDRSDLEKGSLRWDAITPPEFLPLDAERVAEAARNGVCTPYEKQYIRKDGSRVWVLVGFALLGESRELSVAYILDISAKKRAEDGLQESEHRFRLVVEGAPVGILIHSGGTIRYSNDTACELLGATDYAALIGTRMADRVHPDDRAAVAARIAALGKGVPAALREERLLRMDGTPFLAEVEAVSMSHEDEPGVMVFFRDVTAQKRALDEQQLVSAALEQSAEVAVITDADGTIIYVNPAFERVTGYPREEVLGQNPRLLKSGHQPPVFYQRMWVTLAAGDVFAGTMINRRKNGEHYAAEVSISPIRDAAGRVTRYLGLQRDITREHELEDQLRQAQKMDAVGRLTGGIAHDFNNILGVVLANAAVLRRDLPPERTDLFDYVDDLLESATHGAAVVRKLLAFSRREHLSPTTLDLGRALEDVGRTLQRFLPETIRVTIQAERTLTATVDVAALDQIMLNLATNSRDAMPAGGTLTIRASEVELVEGADAAVAEAQPGRYVCVEVTDTGHGMNQETMAHAFEPFFTTKPAGSGTGLGLAMVFGLMRQHRGSVRITSAPGVGTTARLYFRASRPTPAPSVQPAASAETAPVTAGGTILVVEDQERLRRATARALNRLGYQVIVSADGNEALRVLAGHAGVIDLVLSDVVMPGLSGVALYRRLRAEGHVVPFLLMSGYAPGTGETQEPLDDIPIIMKPWTLEALGERVRQLIANGPGH